MSVNTARFLRDAEMPTGLMKAIVAATQNAIRVQCRRACESRGTRVLQGWGGIGGDLIATIDLESASFRGFIALCLAERAYLDLLNGMLGESYDSLSPERLDGASELLNMIFGQVKTTLTDEKIQMAIPRLLRGAGVPDGLLLPKPSWVLQFRTGQGEFQVLVAPNGKLDQRE